MQYVEATRQGYYGHFREVGSQFWIHDDEPDMEADEKKGVEAQKGRKHFSHNWMKKLSKPKKAKEEPVDEIMDELTDMDDDKLVAYAKANCPGLRVTRAMKDSTIRERIRGYRED